jgi:hypothetical protein
MLRRHLFRWSLVTLIAIVLLCTARLHAQTTFTATVNQAMDDLEEYVAGANIGSIDATSSDLEIVQESSLQIIGLRFGNVTIPRGAIITNAYIQFTADELNSEATSLTIRGEAVDSAATYSNASFAISSRPTTISSALWSPNAWTVLQARGPEQRTSNLKDIVQEIINRGGWKSGNALALVISGSGKRVAESFEGANSTSSGHAPNQAPTIVIEYMVPVQVIARVNSSTDDAEENVSTGAIDITSSDLEFTEDGSPVFQQVVGMRFNGINIPPGSVITNAYIQFTTDETQWNAQTPTLTVHGIAQDNPATFTATTNNISSRPTTTASVQWIPPTWSVLQEQGVGQRTPNLTSIVQELVNRSGWAVGNSMALRIAQQATTPGRRVAESWDGANPKDVESPRLVIEYYSLTPAVAPIGTFPIARNAVWRFNDRGQDLGTAWREVGFNDSLWAFGSAQLGYGDGDEATVVGFGTDANNKYPTTYFRHVFDVTSRANIDSLVIGLLRDDGAVVYLNGVEVARSNMPSGTVTFNTFASSVVDGTAESAWNMFTVPANNLVVGRNVIAVEIHQDRGSSSDISFNFEMFGRKNDVNLITSSSGWEYKEGDATPPATWIQPSFNDPSWKIGRSPLGYGNGSEATVVGFGPNPLNKYMTTYFRRFFTVQDTSGFNILAARIKRDDGAIVYINGVEVFRTNIPSGVVNHTTPATTWIEGREENDWIPINLNKNVVRPGVNLIAVEVHQNSPRSTDMIFDCDLWLRESATSLTQSNSNVVCNPQSSGTIGCFTSVVPTNQTQNLILPETHTFQVIMKSNESRYTTSGALIPNGNDLTTYTADNGSSRKGWVCVNHENQPGGVSVLDVQLNPQTMLWQVNGIEPVDFSPVAGTVRNCSGGITPWGTVITSEESLNTGDANGDGYQDIGWQVEFDPRTRRIRDYDNDGRADKLWSMGRISHENIAVSRDSVTIYQGEDGGTGCLYKHVSQQKGRLESGVLYALRRDSATATTGQWIVVPNTTIADRNNTGTLAAALGATRWGGIEDAEIGPDSMIYFTEKGRGDIWRFRDNGMTVSGIEQYVRNIVYPINTSAGVINESFQTGIDNLCFDGEGNLWAFQDGGRDHIWVIRPGHSNTNPRVELFATTVTGSEPCGLHFTPDFKYGFFSLQNPAGTNTIPQVDASGRSVVMNQSVTVVFGRKEDLGENALAPVINLGNDITVCRGTPVTLRYNNNNVQNEWSTGSTDTAISVSSSGRYILTGYANNGKVVRDTVNVAFTEPPVLNLGPDRTLCNNEPFRISASGSNIARLTWDNGSQGMFRDVMETGSYVATAVDRNGCSSRDTITIRFTPSPRVELGTDKTICSNELITIDAGEGFTTYRWNTGENTRTIQRRTTGVAMVTVTHSLNNCEGSDTVFIKAGNIANLGNDLTVCKGTDVILNPGNSFNQYLWSNGAVSRTLRANTAGTYWVRTMDDNNCVSFDTLTLTVLTSPKIELGRDTVICNTCSITLDAGSGFRAYKWSTGETTRTITITRGGLYEVTATTNDGCTSVDEIDIRTANTTSVTSDIELLENGIKVMPNPFRDNFKIQFDFQAPKTVSLHLYDMNGQLVGSSLNGELITSHTTTMNTSFNLATGFYLLRITLDDKVLYHRLVKQ